jgi:hypothetical protein
MPKGNQALKKRFEVDGEPLEDLIKLNGYDVTDGSIQVDEIDKSIFIRDGRKVIPEIPATFNVKKGSKTYKILKDWYEKFEFHDVVEIVTDGTGAEVRRKLWPDTEIKNLKEPDFDTSASTFIQVDTTFLPDDIEDIQ